ncbi:MAG: hypothetical protein Kow00121_48400 [Elainellaceae cyanobacterium]
MPRFSDGRSMRKWLGLTALFAGVLSLVVIFSQPSDSQDSSQDSSQTAFQTSSVEVECFGSSATSATARPIAVDQLALGTNLAGIADWSTEMPFIDGFKSARRWITQCQEGDPNCSGEWDTGEFDQLDLDEFGWVKSLPAPEDEPEYTRVGTLMFNGFEGQYPKGQYVVLYEGEGQLEYGFDAQKDEALSAPGRDVINITSTSNNGVLIKITATDPNQTGNYLRNIHFVPIAYEDTFATEFFNPAFINKIDRFQALRFMDWMATNDSEQSEWSDRPQVDDASYAWGKGAPIEIMVALANRLGVSPWFTMPHQATDEYMANFAQTVKTCLNPNLNVYVEFSNEVWNWQFRQANYALEQGQARWGEDKGDAYMQWYGMRTAQMSDIWNQVFADQADRVISVMATQTAWEGLEPSALDCPLWVAEGNRPCYQHNIDVYAIAGYFSGRLVQDPSKEIVKSWLNDPDGGISKAFTQIKQGTLITGEGFNDTLPGVEGLFEYHQNVAQSKGLQLVAYEGGQHLVRSDDEQLTEFFIALNRQPEMYDAYMQLLNSWKANQGNLFMNFSDIGKPSKWGSWGVLEHVDQESSPKYDALMDFLDQNT